MISTRRFTILMVAVVFATFWSSVTCNGKTKPSELSKRKKQFELQRQELEKNYERAVTRLMVMHLENGDDEAARKEFLPLKNRDVVAEEVVQLAYSNKKVGLLQLAKFVCRIDILSVTYSAINAMFQEMAKNSQLQEIEIIPLNYRVQYVANVSSFTSQSSEVKNSFSKLIAQLSPQSQNIMTSLVNDIAVGEFKRPKSVFDVQKNFHNEKYLFFADLVKVYLSSTNLEQFVQMYHFIVQKITSEIACYMCLILWQELNSRGFSGTMEALVVWINASEISQLVRKVTGLEYAQCNSVANCSAPAYKETLTYKYENYIKNGHLKNIQELYKKYRLAFFFAEYISSLTWGYLQKVKLDKLVEAINVLPSHDICTVAAAVYERLNKSEIRGSFEHLQALQIVKKAKSTPNYDQLDKISKSKCDSVSDYIPALFQKILYGDTSNCKLLNRFYKDEPLYCDGAFRLDEIDFKKLYVGTANSDDADRYWNLTLAANSQGVGLFNNFHSNSSLRFIFDNVRAVSATVDLSLDYFRVHIVEDVYIQLEPVSKSVYVGVSSKTCDTDKSCVEMMTDANDKKTQWKLICY